METPLPPPALPQYLQEVELSQENMELILTLPTQEGWIADQFHLYQGFWHSTRHMEAILACEKHFQAHDTDIFLVSTPKSGTTWLKAILFALVNRVHHSPDPQVKQHPLLTNNPHALVPFLELDLYDEKKIPDLTTLSPPRLFATHLPYVSMPQSVIKSGNCKVVYLCRDPKDTIVSLWHFCNKLRRPLGSETLSLEEAFGRFCRGESVCGPFWDHVLQYWKESLERPETIFFVKYEDMKEQPILHLRRLADFLGCPFSLEEETQGVMQDILKLCSFENLSNLDVNKSGELSWGVAHSAYFRQGEARGWKKYLTADMVEQLDRITGEKLQDSGLRF